MRERGSGSIVLIGSAGSGSGGAPGLADIAIAKTAQDTLGRAMARELGPDGIRVNIVAPGLVPTDANAGEHQQQWIDAASAATPLRRVSAPEDIAATVALLAATPPASSPAPTSPSTAAAVSAEPGIPARARPTVVARMRR